MYAPISKSFNKDIRAFWDDTIIVKNTLHAFNGRHQYGKDGKPIVGILELWKSMAKGELLVDFNLSER